MERTRRSGQSKWEWLGDPDRSLCFVAAAVSLVLLAYLHVHQPTTEVVDSYRSALSRPLAVVWEQGDASCAKCGCDLPRARDSCCHCGCKLEWKPSSSSESGRHSVSQVGLRRGPVAENQGGENNGL